jgi:hypothetical protein
VTVTVTIPGVVGLPDERVMLRVGAVGAVVGRGRVTHVVITITDALEELDVGFGSSVTRVVISAGLVVPDVGSSVSLVGMTLRDELAGSGIALAAVETAAAGLLDGVGLLRPYITASKTPLGILATVKS